MTAPWKSSTTSAQSSLGARSNALVITSTAGSDNSEKNADFQYLSEPVGDSQSTPVFTTGYGMRSIMSAAGEPNRRSGRTSASARSASSPAWQTAIPQSFVARAVGRMEEDGLRGKLVRKVGGELAIEREELRRRRERMQHGTAEDAGERMRAVLE